MAHILLRSIIPKSTPTGLYVSSPRTIFLDHNATSPPTAGARAAVDRLLSKGWGNPSSPHQIGRRARQALAEAREEVAALACCDPEHLIFTSGATESCNHVIQFAQRPGRPLPAIAPSTVEHTAVLSATEREAKLGRSVAYLGVNSDGIVDLDSLRDVIQDGNVLVSIQWVNNETGVIQPVRQIAAMCREHGAMLHVDACQALGKLRMADAEIAADFVSLSGHKIGAPPGVGALFVADRRRLPSFLVGGEQEFARRAGTENLPGIVGFGAAARERRGALESLLPRWRQMRQRFERALPSGCRINGEKVERVPNTTSVTFPGVDGAALLARMDARGVCVSQGSACHSARPEPSHVLRAIGLSEADAYSTIRFSWGPETTDEDLSEALRILESELSADRGPRMVAVA